MALSNERLRQIEAEMAKFENEIHTPIQRPPVPLVPNVRFLPHAIQNRGPFLPPPMPPAMLMGMGLPPRIPPMALPPRPMPMEIIRPPRPPAVRIEAPTTVPQVVIPAPNAAPVIEAGPTKYLPMGASVAAGSNVPMPKRQKLQPQIIEPGPSSLAATQSQAVTNVIAQDIELIQQKKQNEAAFQNSYVGQVLSGKRKPKRFMRTGGGQVWEDQTLAEWDPSDYRLFCGDLGNEVSDEMLAKAFRRYTSFQKAKVVRDKRTNKTKGYGFVSFSDAQDFMKAMREMDGKYVGNRPIKLRKSNWRDRNVEVAKKKMKEKQKMGMKI